MGLCFILRIYVDKGLELPFSQLSPPHPQLLPTTVSDAVSVTTSLVTLLTLFLAFPISGFLKQARAGIHSNGALGQELPASSSSPYLSHTKELSQGHEEAQILILDLGLMVCICFLFFLGEQPFAPLVKVDTSQDVAILMFRRVE